MPTLTAFATVASAVPLAIEVEALAIAVGVTASLLGLWWKVRTMVVSERQELAEIVHAQAVVATRLSAIEDHVKKLDDEVSRIPRLITLVEGLERSMRDVADATRSIDTKVSVVSERLARIEGEWHATRNRE